MIGNDSCGTHSVMAGKTVDNIEELDIYLRDLRKLLERYDYRWAFYGHFGQGCIHTRISFDLENGSGWNRGMDSEKEEMIKKGKLLWDS